MFDKVTLFKGLFGKSAVRSKGPRKMRPVIPRLEALEGRLVPTTNYHWMGGHIGNPTDAEDGRNWVDDNGVPYSRSNIPGSTYDDAVVLFDSHATADCDFPATAGQLVSMSSDANFAFNVNLGGGFTVDNPATFQKGTFTLGSGTSTFTSQLVLKQPGQWIVSAGATLVCNGDAAYTWGVDTLNDTSLAVDTGTLILGGGTVQVAKNAFFPHNGKLSYNDRGAVSTFSGSGGEVWFDSGILSSEAIKVDKNFELDFKGIDVFLSFNSNVNLQVNTVAGTSYWSDIHVVKVGINGGHFEVTTNAEDNVTLNMYANVKPTGSSHTLIQADVDLSGNGAAIFQNFTKSGGFQAWTAHSWVNPENFVLTY